MGAPRSVSPARLVLDTNVLLSALLFPSGSLSWLRHAWQAGEIVPLASPETTRELVRVLCYPKFDLTEEEREDLLAEYLPWCETVLVSEPPDVPACRDPADVPFLQLALAGHADAVVTGDDDLLAIARQCSVPILAPTAMRARLGANRPRA